VEVEEEITRLGLAYELLTRNTSFVAVDELVVNALATGREVVQPLPLPAGVPNSAVGMAVGTEPGRILLLIAVLGLWAVVALRLRAIEARR
jgi:Ca-activated chloride channel family protein